MQFKEVTIHRVVIFTPRAIDYLIKIPVPHMRNLLSSCCHALGWLPEFEGKALLLKRPHTLEGLSWK